MISFYPTPVIERFWLDWTLNPHHTSHHVMVCHRMIGSLDDDLIRRVIQALTMHHEALRLRCTYEEQGLMLNIDDEASYELIVDALPQEGFDSEAVQHFRM